MGVGERVTFDAPRLLASEQLRRQLVEHVGGERAGDLRLELALGAVVEQRTSGRHTGSCVREVVGEYLMNIGSTGGSEVPDGLADHAIGEIDGVGGSRKIGSGDRSHAMNLPVGTGRGHLSRDRHV